jgi:hypothetical protein
MTEQLVIPAGGQLTKAFPSDDFNRYIQEMHGLIREKELFMMGQRETTDENGNKRIEQFSEPKINELGKNFVLDKMRDYLNPNTYMAMQKASDTQNNFRIDIRGMRDDLTLNHRRYAVSRSSAWAITDSYGQVIYFAMKKAETDKKYIYDATRTNYNPVPAEPKKGLLGGLFG